MAAELNFYWSMCNYKPKPIEPIRTLPTEDDILIHNILFILSKFGVYGEDATIQLINILKDMGRNDLLPGCCNEKEKEN